MGKFLDALPGIGGVIGGISNIISGNQQAKVARENTDKTIAANKAMAEYQYSKDVEMWNRGNTYNSPTAQMQRLKDAGLNPNLVYGNGAQSQAIGQLPKYNAPTMEYNYKPPANLGSALEGGIGGYQDLQIRQAQLDNLRAQRSATVAATTRQGMQNEILEGTQAWQIDAIKDKARMLWQQREKGATALGLYNKYAEDIQKYSLEHMNQRNLKLEQENQFLIQATENKRLMNEYFLGTNFGGLGLNALKSLGSVGKFFLGNKNTTLKATKPALRVNPNNWPKFKHD